MKKQRLLRVLCLAVTALVESYCSTQFASAQNPYGAPMGYQQATGGYGTTGANMYSNQQEPAQAGGYGLLPQGTPNYSAYSQSPWQRPNGQPVQTAAPPYSSNGYQPAPASSQSPSGQINVDPALRQLVPEFGRPLPQLPPSMVQQNTAAGFGPGYTQQAPMQNAPMPSVEEQRCSRLEQQAFGSTYPEHEVVDRIEHLEREIFNQVIGGCDNNMRLSKLEQRLGGAGAFGSGMGTPAAAGAIIAPPPQSTGLAGANQQRTNMQKASEGNSSGYYQAPPGPQLNQPQLNAPQLNAPQLNAPQLNQPQFNQPQFNQPQSNAAPPTSPGMTYDGTVQSPARSPQPQAASAASNKLIPSTNAIGGSTGNTSNDGGKAASEFQVAVQSIPFDKKVGDYLTAIQKFPGATCAHWTNFPVRVHLPQNTLERWRQALESAVRLWDRVIPIMITQAENPADIEVAWINHLQPHQLGITNLEIFNGHPRITVYLLRPTYYPPEIPEKALNDAVVHEIGHALGLFGHSSNAGDAMQALESRLIKGKWSSVGGLSARDTNTLRKLYESPSLPSGFQSPQPISWP